MKGLSFAFRIAPLVLLMLVVASPAAAQGIAGRVTDASDGAPITGATVVVLTEGAEQVGQATTDQSGAYTVEVPGAGSYLVVVSVQGFANQMSASLSVADGETLSYDLSMNRQRVGETGSSSDQMDDATFLAQYMSETCAGEFIPGLHGILFGAVRNVGTDEPLGAVEVTVRWNEPGFGQQAAVANSDASGFYYICDVPAGRTVEVRAQSRRGAVEGETSVLRLTAGTMRSYDVYIPLSDPTENGNIFGVVRDVDTSRPVGGALVRLVENGRTVSTNQRGNFTLRDVSPGLDIMQVEILGYENTSQAVQVYGGRGTQIEVLVSRRPFELDPIIVSVRPRSWFSDRASLEDRMAVGAGHFLLREDIEERVAASNLGDLMRNIPGVRVRRSGGGVSGSYTVQLRQAANLANEACHPMIYLDGIPLGPDPTAFTDIFAINVEVVEVYRGAAEVPGEFSGGEARCGVIVVWTRRGFGIGG